MSTLINWRIKVTLNDGRTLTGQMLAFDKHMNLVLADCEEFKRIRPKKKQGDDKDAPTMQEQKRTLGLVILRGEIVVSFSVEGPPPAQDDDKFKNQVNLPKLFCPFFLLGFLLSLHLIRGNCTDTQLLCSPFRRIALTWSWPRNAGRPRCRNDATRLVLAYSPYHKHITSNNDNLIIV